MIYIPLWLKVYLLYLWKQEALQEGKTALFVLFQFFFSLFFFKLRSKCQKERSAFLLSCKKKQTKKNISQVTQTEKQKGESIALSLGYYTALQGVGSYWKSFTVYILLYWLVTQKKSTADDLICMAMNIFCMLSKFFFFPHCKK